MVTLSSFIGEMLDNISKARNYSDYGSAMLSEQYFADPFIKSLPIPHYTIDEAEIDVPVMVVGISTNVDEFAKHKNEIEEATVEKLPNLLVRSLKFNYVQTKELEFIETQKKEKQDSFIELNEDLDGERNKKKLYEQKDIPQKVLDNFATITKQITIKMANHVTKYLNSYNYQVLKLLDLSDDFGKQLGNLMSKLFPKLLLAEISQPTEEQISRSINYISNLMFFEFKKIMQNDCGVEIDVSTAKMNEFSAKVDCLMHIKLKIKEQDLSLLVENKDGKEKRFLSLT